MKSRIIAIVIGIISGCFVGGYMGFQDGKFCVNNERVGIMFLQGGYRAYWIRYSNGLKYPYRTLKDNLWCWPRFEHCDVRPLMKWRVR